MSPRFAFTPLPTSRADLRKPSALAGLVGTWRGELVDEAGVAEAFTLIRDASSDAAVAGRFLFFVSHDVAPTGVKLLEAANASFVALIGPYYHPREQTEVLTVLEGVRRGARIEGTFHTRLPGWRDSVRMGRFTAIRADGANKAA
jgi:hypothetical protein